ncbi:LAQU0S13e01332g1_1 [Lachancea quebecensis]|uniref:Carbonic anhydrase n=1 Tax=Lachancea quebecensis TaxID=1654605 RepID=A0A0P1KV59_9SACH|nr:LAQU0S13e01332g1_1 [Lachancea quebecensis]
MSPAATNIFTLTHNSELPDLLEANNTWSEKMTEAHPTLFKDFNAHGQAPHTLFIGCSDSRYNEQCLGVIPGEIFTWKTIANVISDKDLTCRATLEFAINVLKVNKVVVCGHTDCGGINTCLALKREALNDGECSHLYQYLQDVDDLYHEHKEEVKAATNDVAQQSRMLSRLNVAKQYQRLLEIDTVQKALARGDISVYGLLYDVATGRVEQVSNV